MQHEGGEVVADVRTYFWDNRKIKGLVIRLKPPSSHQSSWLTKWYGVAPLQEKYEIYQVNWLPNNKNVWLFQWVLSRLPKNIECLIIQDAPCMLPLLETNALRTEWSSATPTNDCEEWLAKTTSKSVFFGMMPVPEQEEYMKRVIRAVMKQPNKDLFRFGFFDTYCDIDPYELMWLTVHPTLQYFSASCWLNFRRGAPEWKRLERMRIGPCLYYHLFGDDSILPFELILQLTQMILREWR